MREYLKIYRTRRIEIGDLVEYMFASYKADIISTIDAFDTMDDVSSETRHDLYVFTERLALLNQMTFIDDEEEQYLRDEAEKFRLDRLNMIEGDD